MSMKLKAELVMAVEGYDCEGRETWSKGLDLTASDAESNKKILLRVMTGLKSESQVVGVDAVRKMVETIEEQEFDRGILFGERFSSAARRELTENGIRMISGESAPSFDLQKLYFAIQNQIDEMCKDKCGRVPKKEIDCKGKKSDGNYSCNVRLISDNALFHFEHGWTKLLTKDLMQLLKMQKTAK